MNLYKKNQYRYTESMVKRSEIRRTSTDDYLEETSSGKSYLISEPFRYTLKDIKDTIKPYKTQRQRVRDALQFFRGMGNAATGLMMMFVVPFMVVIGFGNAISEPRKLLPSLFKALVITPIESTVILLRGIFQIVTSPLALLRIPLRTFINRIVGTPKIEDNAGIISLVKQAQKIQENGLDANSTALINFTITQKCIKANARGQQIGIAEVEAVLASDEKNKKITYQMFIPKQPAKALKIEGEASTICLDQTDEISHNQYSVTASPTP